MGKLKILLADDYPLIRQGLKSIIETLDPVAEILEADNGKRVIELSRQHQIDLFILDYRMPEMGGYDVAKILLARNPKTKIIIITAFSESDLIANVLNLGVRGFLSKTTDIAEIRLALNKVLTGEIYLDKLLEDRMQRESGFSKKNPLPLTFTKRENDLMLLLSKGNTSKDISLSLGVTQKTIEIYRSRLLEKTGVRNSVELVDYFHSNGLI